MNALKDLTEVCPECHGFLAMACPTCRGVGMVAPTPKVVKIQTVVGATVHGAPLCDTCLARVALVEPHLEVYPSQETRCAACGAH